MSIGEKKKSVSKDVRDTFKWTYALSSTICGRFSRNRRDLSVMVKLQNENRCRGAWIISGKFLPRSVDASDEFFVKLGKELTLEQSVSSVFRHRVLMRKGRIRCF